jgi:hypothetical protein
MALTLIQYNKANIPYIDLVLTDGNNKKHRHIDAHTLYDKKMIKATIYCNQRTDSKSNSLELQRDWARLETYEAVTSLAMEDAGTYGMEIEYAKAMLGETYTRLDLLC